MDIKGTPHHSIKLFRYRVHCLAKELWKEKDPVCRVNLTLQLADAVTSLARLEVQEAKKCQHSSLSASDSELNEL
ncbi:hypothetical protein QQ054_02140 [Oscillatoria amoena NRMC-F 0135]|nr:hypothetical protein [Geitlerinema splendidum]MDL5044843.1 hypothetical protein [Oscillatoria amoena NRMC-F 0135]NES96338.1 hypothetical protein [Desertifilum sp. SIO1I2]